MLRGVRFCSSLHLLSELAARGACAKDNKVYRVMIPYGKCLVNYLPSVTFLFDLTRMPMHFAFAGCCIPESFISLLHVVRRDFIVLNMRMRSIGFADEATI